MMEGKTVEKRCLTVTVPMGATCSLYPQVPASVKYSDAIDPQKEILPAQTTVVGEVQTCIYGELESGLYYVTASLEGFYSVC